MGKPKKAAWPPYLPADVTLADVGDERLAWLAAEPEIERRTRPTGSTFVHFFSGGVGGDIRRERREQLRAAYAPAIAAAAARFTPEEAAALRRSGSLPPWFFDVVEQHRGTVR